MLRPHAQRDRLAGIWIERRAAAIGNRQPDILGKNAHQAALRLLDAAVKQNDASQIDGLRAALSVLAVMGVIALFFTGRIPKKEPGSELAPA